MKKILFITICAAFMLAACTGDEVAVSDVSSRIQDTELRSFCAQFDTDGDGVLRQSECDAVKKISLEGGMLRVRSLAGIEVFTSLEELYCANNAIEVLDVSGMHNLKHLNCSRNDVLRELRLNPELERLFCHQNALTQLDVSKCANLQRLDCMSNKLVKLNVSANTKLEYLYCDRNKLIALDVSRNSNLITLVCSQNSITTLDVSKNGKLQMLSCHDNLMTALDVSDNVDLLILNCGRQRNEERFDLTINEDQLELWEGKWSKAEENTFNDGSEPETVPAPGSDWEETPIG